MIKRYNWLIRLMSIVLVSVVFTLTLLPDSLNSHSYKLINLALFLAFSSFLLLPVPEKPVHVLANSITTVLLLLVLSQLLLSNQTSLIILSRVSLVMLGLSLFLWSLRQFFATLLKNKYPHTLILYSSALILSAPLWSGPLVDAYQPGDIIINSIINISPLTHFSVAAEHDYLRNEWFYQNSTFGSLPFTYPSLISIISAYLIITAIMLMIKHWFSANRQKLSPFQQRIFTFQKAEK